MQQHVQSRGSGGKPVAEQVFREFAWSLASTLKLKRAGPVRKRRVAKAGR